jgi:hypothetical protein
MKLDNFHLVSNGGNKAVMVIDLERVNELPPHREHGLCKPMLTF